MMQPSMLEWMSQGEGRRPRLPEGERERYRASRRLQQTRSLTPPRTPPKPKKPPVPDRPHTGGTRRTKGTLPAEVCFGKPDRPPSLKGSSLSAKLERIALVRANSERPPPPPVMTPPRTRERFAQQIGRRTSPSSFEMINATIQAASEDTSDAKATESAPKSATKMADDGEAVTKETQEEEAKQSQDVSEEEKLRISARNAAAAAAERRMKDSRKTVKIDPVSTDMTTEVGHVSTEVETEVESVSADVDTGDEPESTKKEQDEDETDEECGIMVEPRSPCRIVQVSPYLSGVDRSPFQASALLRKKSPVRSSAGFET